MRRPGSRGSTTLFFMPVGLASVVLVVIPALATIGLAFANYDGVRSPTAAGFENFRRLASDPLFRTALRNSLIFAALAVPLRLMVAFGVGLLVAPDRRGSGPARTAVAMPSFVPDVAYALLWLWVFNPLYGPLAAVFRAVGLPGTEWVLSPWGARVSIVIMSAFQVVEAVIVVMAVRNQIPNELYEAAAVEGAGRARAFGALTLPLMMPTLLLLAARDVALSLQTSFVPALVLTEGGPNYATIFLPLYTYQNAFEFLRFGYAAAMTLVMFAVTCVMIGLQVVVVRRWRSALWS